MKKNSKMPSKVATGNVEIQTTEDSVYSQVGMDMFPYKQKTVQEYLSFIKDLNLSDLQRHAVEKGIIPNATSRSILEDRLEKEYLKKRYAFVDVKIADSNGKSLSKKDQEDIESLLYRGR